MTLIAERALLIPVLDALIPASGDFPGAGTVALDHVLASAATSPAAAGRSKPARARAHRP